jgi:hypothetical protein
MLMFMKAEVVGVKEGQPLVQIKCDDSSNWIPIKSVNVGTGTNAALLTIEKEDDKKRLRYELRSCLVATVTYMQTRLPLANPVLRDLQCLHPIVRKTQEGKISISNLCTHLKKVTKSDAFCDKVHTEWLMYMCESDQSVNEWQGSNPGEDHTNICAYWNSVSKIVDGAGDKKYKSLSALVKSALTLSHGNSVPERGFSVNNSLLSKERLGLAEKTIIAERVVKEAVRVYGGVTAVPVTKKLIASVRQSHAEYILAMENEAKNHRAEKQKQLMKAQQIEEKRKVRTKQEDVRKQLHEQQILEETQINEQETARALIGEASKKLTNALQNNDMKGAKVAQVMLTAGNDKLCETAKQLNDIRQVKLRFQEKLENFERELGPEDEQPAMKKMKK